MNTILVVTGFQLLIETEPDLDICPQAGAVSEALALIANGLKIRAIAHKLHLGIKTIEPHRLNITSKLRLENASELVRSHTAVAQLCLVLLPGLCVNVVAATNPVCD